LWCEAQVVFGLTALPGARLIFRFKAKPRHWSMTRHWSMKGARHAMKALSTPGWTMIDLDGHSMISVRFAP